MKAIILSAGLGTRLYPITSEIPKPGLKIVGKMMLERAIESVIDAGIPLSDIVIVIGPENQFKQLLKLIEKKFSCKCTYAVQEKRMGTADALKVGLSKVSPDEDIIVLNGDVIIDKEAVKKFIDTVRNQPETGFLAVTDVENWHHFGVVLGTDDGRITGIIEKPDTKNNNFVGINAGIYYFPSKYLDAIKKITLSKRGEYELPDLISINLEKGNEFYYFKFEGLWTDVGRPYDLLNIHEELMELEKNSFDIKGDVEPGVYIHGTVYVAPGAKIRSGAYLEGLIYIDEDADIGPNCYIRGKTYIGTKVRIGNACEVKNSIIYDGTHIAHLSYVGDSIIGQNCNFGAGTITANLRHDNKNVKITIKGERVDSGRRKLGVIMGNNVKTGIGVSILPGVVIGNNSWIAAGITVDRDVPDNVLLYEKNGEKQYKEK